MIAKEIKTESKKNDYQHIKLQIHSYKKITFSKGENENYNVKTNT